ncbi:hypothetical protein TNCT_129911 [Trichonephila clavata]|uniref:Uncharacterized protein n=1 Tax=Trichonephila clavata TaxID=2740835 RepID=A0A8X6FQG3_TRICU|nr:hypothetical protein TNCT_129911 [Trichonephila clavata]
MSTTKSSQPKTTEGCERPIGNMEKRPSFHPYRFEKDDDIVCLSREKKPEEEYSAASPPIHAMFADVSALVSVFAGLFRNTPSLKTPTPDVRASFPKYNLIKTYFSSNFVQYIPQNDFGMGFPKYVTYKMGNRKMTYVAANK